MARPFFLPALIPAKDESSIRPYLTFQNKFTALDDYPKLPSLFKPKLLKPLCPTQPKLINLRPTKTSAQEASSSVIQTRTNYAMKTPESFAQSVNQELTKTIPSKILPKEETFDFIVSQVLCLMYLNKECVNMDIHSLIRPCFKDNNSVDTKNPLKTRRFYEAILVDTDSIENKHSKDANNYIQYSRFTIKGSWILFNGLQPIYILLLC